jgi:hypothetical protein
MNLVLKVYRLNLKFPEGYQNMDGLLFKNLLTMETNNQKSENGRSNGPVNKQDNENKLDQSRKDRNEPDKKPVFIKDMPPIDGAKPGVI